MITVANEVVSKSFPMFTLMVIGGYSFIYTGWIRQDTNANHMAIVTQRSRYVRVALGQLLCIGAFVLLFGGHSWSDVITSAAEWRMLSSINWYSGLLGWLMSVALVLVFISPLASFLAGMSIYRHPAPMGRKQFRHRVYRTTRSIRANATEFVSLPR